MANNERISVLMDGELAEASWLRSAIQDAEQQETWSRYHLIGDVLRNELPDTLNWDLADKIAMRLEEEPTILAPRPSLWRERVRPAAANLLRHGGQFAIAASVAAMSIIGVRYYQHNQLMSNSPSPVLNTVPIGGVAAPVSVNYQARQPLMHAPQPVQNDAQNQAQQERISAFLRDHQLQQRLHQANE